MIYDKVSHTIPQLIATNYMIANSISPIPTKLLRTANTYAKCYFNEPSLQYNISGSDSTDNHVTLSTWEAKARAEIANIILDLILERDVWSLSELFSDHTLERVLSTYDCEIKVLFNKLIGAIEITIDKNALDSQAYSLIEKRKDQELLLKIAKKGVASKFLKKICRLSSTQIKVLQKFANANRPKSGGQTKIDSYAREQIIAIWNLNEEHNQLRRFQQVLEKTNYDAMTASRVIASI